MKTDMSEKPENENEQATSSGLDDPPCSPLVAPGAIADTLEIIEEWADEFKKQVHPASLVLYRAANTIRDLYNERPKKKPYWEGDGPRWRETPGFKQGRAQRSPILEENAKEMRS